MIIVGIDPGINNIGVAHFDTDTNKVLYTGIVQWYGSYEQVYLALAAAVALPPFDIAIETPFFTSKTLQHNVRTLEIIGLLKMLAEKIKCPLTQYSPPTIKKEFTGNGRASKEDIIEEVQRKFNLRLNTSHEADAVAIAYTHYVKCPDLHTK